MAFCVLQCNVLTGEANVPPRHRIPSDRESRRRHHDCPSWGFPWPCWSCQSEKIELSKAASVRLLSSKTASHLNMDSVNENSVKT